MTFISEDRRTITLPVPLGENVYQIHLDCFDGCTFQRELFDIQFVADSEKSRCGNAPCHTRFHSIEPKVLTLVNIDWVLNGWGKTFFETEELAFTQAMKDIENNRELLLEKGFKLDEKGYSVIKNKVYDQEEKMKLFQITYVEDEHSEDYLTTGSDADTTETIKERELEKKGNVSCIHFFDASEITEIEGHKISVVNQKKLSDLIGLIDDEAEVGVTDRNYSDFPLVDTWINWRTKRFKTLDIPVKTIKNSAFILLVLDVE